MLKSYLKVAVRNLLKYKVFSFINTFGLALAMSVGMLVILMLADQKRYDQFHTKKQRIFRILSDKDDSKFPSATSPFSLSEALRGYSVIEKTTHLTRGVAGDLVTTDRTLPVKGYFADSAFFSVFDFVVDDPAKALLYPNSIVITASFARKAFGNTTVIGKTVELRDPAMPSEAVNMPGDAQSWGTYTIAGIIADEETKSHLVFDILVSSSSLNTLVKQGKVPDLTGNWHSNQSYTYALMAPEKTLNDLTAVCRDLLSRKKSELQDVKGLTFIPQPLSDITPGILVSNESRASLPLAAYYFLSALALIILLSACLNYTNLSIARALTRAREIGVRKVNGAFRRDLVYQFLSEALITAVVALGVAFVLVLFLRTAFLHSWINQHLQFEMEADLSVYPYLILFALVTGLIAGIYPALYLSKFQPIAILRNVGGSRVGKIGMRKVLAICQFVISLFFITTSLLLVKQFRHFMHFEYGFNSENIINVQLHGNDHLKVAHAFSSVPGVSTISACNYVPSTGTNNGTSLRVAGTDRDYQQLTILLTDEHFVENLGIRIVAGQGLLPSDTVSRLVLLNEAAVKAFGYDSPAGIIGQYLESAWGGQPLQVIGVTSNFFVKAPFGSDKGEPIILLNDPDQFEVLNVRVTSPHLATTIEDMEDAWKTIDHAHAFNYRLYDDQLDEMHAGFLDLIAVIGFVAFIAITIACLGLLGMSVYISERKKKEVGIRKVLGADGYGIVMLLSKDFLKILFISVLIGAPLSFFVNDLWLQRFPNRVPFGFTTLCLGATVLLVLGFITIASQTVNASKRNPVEALKSD